MEKQQKSCGKKTMKKEIWKTYGKIIENQQKNMKIFKRKLWKIMEKHQETTDKNKHITLNTQPRNAQKTLGGSKNKSRNYQNTMRTQSTKHDNQSETIGKAIKKQTEII